MKRILIINPNSSAAVTRGIAEALAGWPGARFDVIDQPAAPATIASDADVARSGVMLAERIAGEPADAYVIACFSDPGLEMARSLTAAPVIGIMEAGILTAMARADRFGVIALSPRSVARHLRRIRGMGVLDRLVANLPLGGVSAEDSGTSDAVYADTRARAERLVAQGAGAIVPGCAGFAPRRAQLEADLGVPVIDPVQAACAMALGAVLA